MSHRVRARNLSRTIRILSAILVATGMLAHAGESGLPPEDWIGKNSAALAICLKVKFPMGNKENPHRVFFARLEEGEDIESLVEKTELFPSALNKGCYAYLLGVPPGTYVVVAAVSWREDPPDTVEVASVESGPIEVGLAMQIVNDPDALRYYLSRELIQETRTTVEPRVLAFMGKFVGKSSHKIKNADDTQRHFMLTLEGKQAETGKWSKAFGHGMYSFFLRPHAVDRGEEVRAEFVEKARKHLEDNKWAAVIDDAGSDSEENSP